MSQETEPICNRWQEKVLDKFNEAIEDAKRIITDKKKISALLDKAHEMLDALKRVASPKYKQALDEVQTLMRLIRTWVSGEYTNVPVWTIIMAVAAILYLVNPFDIIPDTIPVVGLLDDAFVIRMVCIAIMADLDAFRKWENSRGSGVVEPQTA
ncbi:MAG: DUF1232 domain-containing protein [Nitrospirae bacterium]|nr:DUF1232 domain-containing protein [Nitrospirota bacterium]